MGRTAEARRIAEGIEAATAAGRRSAHGYNVARLYVFLGDTARALARVTRFAKQLHLQRLALGTDPVFDPLRANPGFQALLSQLRLTSP